MKPNPSVFKLRDQIRPHREALEALAQTLQKGEGDGLLIAGCIRLAFECIAILDDSEQILKQACAQAAKDAIMKKIREHGFDRMN